jgi:hypothetical protein
MELHVSDVLGPASLGISASYVLDHIMMFFVSKLSSREAYYVRLYTDMLLGIIQRGTERRVVVTTD